MTKNETISHWKSSAERDFSVAEDLFRLKKYDYCLYFCHLSIEKMIKGLLLKNTNTPAPPSHNLIKLCKLAKSAIDDTQTDDLLEITSWNIEARYDDYKQKFYKKANRSYVNKWLHKSQEYLIWFKNQY